MPKLPLILQAFAPEEAVLDPDMFAGRDAQIRELAESLHDRGSIPIIFGHRGVGKTTVALQHANMAKGDSQLLTRLRLQELSLREPASFNVLWVEGTQVDGVASLERLLCQLIAAHYLPSTPDRYPTKTTRKVGIDLKAIKGETQREFEHKISQVAQEDLDLQQILNLYRTHQRRRLLVIIDEFDQTGGRDSIAPWLHSLQPESVRVVLCGIAQDYHDLTGHHPSLQRKLRPVYIPPMTGRELIEILDRARLRLARDGLRINVTEAAREALVDSSGGFPWFMQFLGRQAFLDAVESGRSEVTPADVEAAKEFLSRARWAEALERQYLRAATAGPHVESAVRFLSRNADSISQELPATSLRSFLREVDAAISPDVIIRDLRELGVLAPRDATTPGGDAILVMKDPYFRIYTNNRRRINPAPRANSGSGPYYAPDHESLSRRLVDHVSKLPFERSDLANPECMFLFGQTISVQNSANPVVARAVVTQDVIGRYQRMRGRTVVSHYNYRMEDESKSSGDNPPSFLKTLGVMADWSRCTNAASEAFDRQAQDLFLSLVNDGRVVARSVTLHRCPDHGYPDTYRFLGRCIACGRTLTATPTIVWFLDPECHVESLTLANVITRRTRIRQENSSDDNNFRLTSVSESGVPVPAIFCDTCDTVPLLGEEAPRAIRDLPQACPRCGRRLPQQCETLSQQFELACLYVSALTEYSDLRSRSREHLAKGTLFVGPWETFLWPASLANRVFGEAIWRSQGFTTRPWVSSESALPIGGMRLGSWGMSTSRGNILDMRLQVQHHGADSVRAMLAIHSPIGQPINWSPSSLEHYSRLWSRVWEVCSGKYRVSSTERIGLAKEVIAEASWEVGLALESYQFNRIDTCLRKLVGKLRSTGTSVEIEDDLVRIIAPVAPFTAQGIWVARGRHSMVRDERWPRGQRPEEPEWVRMRVQVNSRPIVSVEVARSIDWATAKRVSLSAPAVAGLIGTSEVKFYGRLPFLVNLVPVDPCGTNGLSEIQSHTP